MTTQKPVFEKTCYYFSGQSNLPFPPFTLHKGCNNNNYVSFIAQSILVKLKIFISFKRIVLPKMKSHVVVPNLYCMASVQEHEIQEQ